MSTLTAIAVAGAAVLAPTLLQTIAREAPAWLPAYVTTAQRAAVTSLAGPICGISAAQVGDWQVTHRVLEVFRALVPLRGAAPGPGAYAKLTGDDADALATALLGALSAGASVTADGVERYQVFVGESSLTLGLLSADAAAGYRKQILDEVVAGATPDVSLTDLGAAALVVAQRQLGMTGGWAQGAWGDDANFDSVAASRELTALALEMDNVGYLVGGKPAPDPSVWDGAGAAAAAVGTWATGLGGRAIGFGAEAAAALALSTPGLLAIAAYLGYRMVRAS